MPNSLSVPDTVGWWAQVDSNHRPRAYQARALTTWAMSPLSYFRCISSLSPFVFLPFEVNLTLYGCRLCRLVEMMGFEPMTPCLQGRCSPNWATPPYFRSFPLSFERSLKIEQWIQRLPSLIRLTTDIVFLSVSILHRKEVIQPHLPIRLPCYDLTPIIEPTFDHCLLAVSTWASGVPNFHGLTGGVYKARERIHRGMLIRDY